MIGMQAPTPPGYRNAEWALDEHGWWLEARPHEGYRIRRFGPWSSAESASRMEALRVGEGCKCDDCDADGESDDKVGWRFVGEFLYCAVCMTERCYEFYEAS
jgi:hypothetical protein